MNRQEMHCQAMLQELGAAYYQAVHGQGSAAKVASAVQAVAKADAETTGQPQARPGHPGPTATSGAAHWGKRWGVRDVMTAPALPVTEHTTYKQVARLLSERQLSSLPVLSRGGRVIGVVSEADLLGVFLRPDEEIAAEVRAALTDVLMADPAAVRVRVGQGLVSLSGQVADAGQISLATDLVTAIDGVIAVRSELTASTAR